MLIIVNYYKHDGIKIERQYNTLDIYGRQPRYLPGLMYVSCFHNKYSR